MSTQYKRAYELLLISQEGESKSIKDLRVNFEITKTVLSFPNLAKISIYNPNEDTLSLLEEKYSSVVLNAGYEGNLRLIYKGQIRNVYQTKLGVDRIVTFYSGDGERDFQTAIFNKTFSENVSISAAIKEVINSFKEVTIGTINGLPQVADKLRGQTLSGSSKDILDNFAEEYGFTWSIQDGEVIVTPVEEPLQDEEAVLINASTGMIGSPTVTDIGANVTCLLNPRLLPNKAVKIESVNSELQLSGLLFREVKTTRGEGTYKIQEVVFKGDSREGDWISTVKGRNLDGR